ncbi:MAG: TRM11 family SAM-dependent methyltransferase [Bacteroidota bacterium]
MIRTDYKRIISDGITTHLFPNNLELLSGITEIYELELAFLESQLLKEEEIFRNGAYFVRVDDRLTRHYLMCKGEPVKLPQYSSSRLKSFFQTNQFKTGYATHGLFPYRGKFHPQMVKALINIMGLKPGDVVLDPMMGSGTVLLEACLMGIKSIGVDVSPFCRFMTKVKLDGLVIPLEQVKIAANNNRKVFDYFKNGINPLKENLSLTEGLYKTFESINLPEVCNQSSIFNFLLLAFLDSAGYSERSNKKSHFEQFKAILERYIFVIEKIQRSIYGTENELADATIMNSDARCLAIDDNKVDGIIFSPPYSFAIDYLGNDSFHLKYLGEDILKLRESMIGLRGRTLREKFDLYLQDMRKVISECSRVLRPGKFCTIIIGTNDNQLSKILKKPTYAIQSLDEVMVEYGKLFGLELIRKIERQITGIANTMRTESIVILQKA